MGRCAKASSPQSPPNYLTASRVATMRSLVAGLWTPAVHATGLFVAASFAVLVGYSWLTQWHFTNCAGSNLLQAALTLGSPTCTYALTVLTGISGHWATLWACAGVGTVAWIGSRVQALFVSSDAVASVPTQDNEHCTADEHYDVSSHSSRYIISVLVDQLARWRLVEPRLLLSQQMLELQRHLHRSGTSDGARQSRPSGLLMANTSIIDPPKNSEGVEEDVARRKTSFLWSCQQKLSSSPLYFSLEMCGDDEDIEIEEIFNTTGN